MTVSNSPELTITDHIITPHTQTLNLTVGDRTMTAEITVMVRILTMPDPVTEPPTIPPPVEPTPPPTNPTPPASPDPLPLPAVDIRVRADHSKAMTNQMQQGLHIINNDWIYPNAASAVAKFAPYARAVYDYVGYHLSEGFGTGCYWPWNGQRSRPPATAAALKAGRNLDSLQRMVKVANQVSHRHVIQIWNPSWWQRGTASGPLVVGEEFEPEKGRLGTDYKGHWDLQVEDMAYETVSMILAEHENAEVVAQMNNELKGMWQLLQGNKVVRGQNWADGRNPGTPGHFDIDIGPLYALSIAAFERGALRAGLKRDRLRFGAPYAVIQSEGKKNANALPDSHPLGQRAYGNLSKMPFQTVERMLDYALEMKLPLDMIVVDGGTNNKDQVYSSDIWKLMEKVSDTNRYLRSVAERKGIQKPIWWAERYFTERPNPGAAQLTPLQNSMERRAVVMLHGFMESIYSGAGVLMQWGMRGEDADPALGNNREVGAYFKADGTPTKLYDAIKAVKQIFPAGTKVYPINTDARLGGGASDKGYLIYNKTDKPLTVGIEDSREVLTLTPSAYAVVDI